MPPHAPARGTHSVGDHRFNDKLQDLSKAGYEAHAQAVANFRKQLEAISLDDIPLEKGE